MVCRSDSGFWPCRDHPCGHSLSAKCGAMVGRPLHNSSLLVHCLDFLRQSGRGDRAVIHQFFFGYSPGRCFRVHRCRALRGCHRIVGNHVVIADDPRREAARSRGQAMSVTIYHNPDCGTSRNTLAMIRQSGVEPTIIEYLKTPPSREKLKELIVTMGISVRDLLRQKGTPYNDLGLNDPKWTDEQLIDQMLADPILINRPIVVTEKGVKLCRPSETVLPLLLNPHIGSVHQGGRRSD